MINIRHPQRSEVNVGRINLIGQRSLNLAVKKNNIPGIERLLSLGANVNFRDQKNATPLILAASQSRSDSHLRAMELLLKNGADVNARDELNNTVLHHLGDSRNIKMIQLCLEFGANVNIKNTQGEIALFYAVRGNRAEVVQLFLDHGSDVNSVDFTGKTPLHLAASNTRYNALPEAVEVLLKNGGDTNAKDHEGKIPIFYAEENLRVVQLILEYSGNRDICKVNNWYTERNRSSVVHWVSKFFRYEVMKQVLKNAHAHEYLNKLDSIGHTPLMSMLDRHRHYLNFNIYSSKLVFLLKHSDLKIEGSENILEMCKNKQASRVVLEHVAKIQALGEAVSQSIVETVESRDDNREYFKECQNELAKAKVTKVGKKCWVTFFNLLMDCRRKLKNYAGNRDLIIGFKKTVCLELFPIYGPIMQKNVEKGIKMRKAYDKSAGMLSNVLPIFGPTHLIIRDALDYLNLKDFNGFLSKV